MELVAIVTLLAVGEFIFFGALVGAARGKYGVPAPATSGNEEFERRFRVHYNTLEQLIIFLPGLWLFGIYVDWTWGAVVGAVYVVGRAVYARAYLADPATRGTGMLLSVIPCWILVLGGLAGAVWNLFSA